jgi:uncharacterized cupredoxin-like copper-binding protein
MKRMFTLLLQFSVLGLLVLSVAGCSSGNAMASTKGADGTTVKVSLVSFKITPDITTIPAGKVTFKATNIDSVKHEMLVIPTLTGINLPYNKAISRVFEDKIQSMGEVAEIEGGTSGEVSLDLKPGTYVLICNLVAHYESGMHTLITVK